MMPNLLQPASDAPPQPASRRRYGPTPAVCSYGIMLPSRKCYEQEALLSYGALIGTLLLRKVVYTREGVYPSICFISTEANTMPEDHPFRLALDAALLPFVTNSMSEQRCTGLAWRVSARRCAQEWTS